MQCQITEHSDDSGRKQTIVTLSGDIGIAEIEQLHEQLLPALSSTVPVVFATDGITSADFSLVQLLAAVRKAIPETQPRLLLSPPGESLRQAIENAGYAGMLL